MSLKETLMICQKTSPIDKNKLKIWFVSLFRVESKESKYIFVKCLQKCSTYCCPGRSCVSGKHTRSHISKDRVSVISITWCLRDRLFRSYNVKFLSVSLLINSGTDYCCVRIRVYSPSAALLIFIADFVYLLFKCMPQRCMREIWNVLISFLTLDDVYSWWSPFHS